MTELEDSLEGGVLECYHIITYVGEPKYETVRDGIVHQVKRIKTGAKYSKTNDFEKV